MGSEIRDQLVDIVGRVKGARRYAVKLMWTLLSDDTMLRNAEEEGSCSEVLWAAAWICGEYSRCLLPLHSVNPSYLYLRLPFSELMDPHKLIPHLLQPGIEQLAPDILSVYIMAITKVFGSWAADLAQRWEDDDLPQATSIVESILTRLDAFSSSPHVEVQERVRPSYILP